MSLSCASLVSTWGTTLALRRCSSSTNAAPRGWLWGAASSTAGVRRYR
jgi:hypothetical protein